MDNCTELYLRWRQDPGAEILNNLMAEVRLLAMRMTHDDDVAQRVCLVVLSKLDSYKLLPDTPILNWIRSIIRRTRLDAYAISSDHTREYDDAAAVVWSEAPFVDTSGLPTHLRHVADLLLAGYSLRETAEQIGSTGAALRNKLLRFRKKALRNAVPEPSLEVRLPARLQPSAI